MLTRNKSFFSKSWGWHDIKSYVIICYILYSEIPSRHTVMYCMYGNNMSSFKVSKSFYLTSTISNEIIYVLSFPKSLCAPGRRTKVFVLKSNYAWRWWTQAYYYVTDDEHIILYNHLFFSWKIENSVWLLGCLVAQLVGVWWGNNNNIEYEYWTQILYIFWLAWVGRGSWWEHK